MGGAIDAAKPPTSVKQVKNFEGAKFQKSLLGLKIQIKAGGFAFAVALIFVMDRFAP